MEVLVRSMELALAKKQELKDFSSEAEIDLMKVIKKSFDPISIL